MKRLLTFLILVFLLLLFVASGCAVADQLTVPDKAPQTPSPTQIDPNKPIKVVVSSDGQNQGIDPWTKDLWDIVAKIGTLLGLVIAGVAAYIQVNRNRQIRQNEIDARNDAVAQRRDELEWKKDESKRQKADLARTVLGEMFKDAYSLDAMSMLDWSSRDYDVKSSRGGSATVEEITERDVWAGLRVAERRFDAKEWYIRDCFDHFFAVMEILQHYIEIHLIDPDDVKYPFARYADLMKGERKGERALYEHFIKLYHPAALSFLERLPEWTENHLEGDPYKAAFMFDCPPGKERFVLMLTDREKIKTARETILTNDEELHVDAKIILSPIHYNEPWGFYLDPATVCFVEESYELADQVNRYVEGNLPRKKATFKREDIWHYGGVRLLAEIPFDEFDEDSGQSSLKGEEELTKQGRIRSTEGDGKEEAGSSQNHAGDLA